jgi:Asp-tRNA(Asn)/Glu-tRNA(Gln) amidotransferase B subunit
LETPHPGEEIVEGEWLSVADAVAYCAAHGLIRNIKTVRRWAHRSFAHPESADVLVRKQDTETDFRYVIERSSLDVKISQELVFEAQKKPARVTAPEQHRPGQGW